MFGLFKKLFGWKRRNTGDKPQVAGEFKTCGTKDAHGNPAKVVLPFTAPARAVAGDSNMRQPPLRNPPPPSYGTHYGRRSVDAAPRTSNATTEPDDGFAACMAVAAATDSVALGMAIGGNPLGAIVGAELAESRSEPAESVRYEPSTTCDTSSSSYEPASSSYSSSDSGSSSSDSGCSYDSGSSSSSDF